MTRSKTARRAGCSDGRAERWALLSRHRDGVLMSLRRRFGDFPDAEDIVDEAMLKLVDTPDLAEQRVGALLYTVAHHLNVDRHRRGIRHQLVAARVGIHPEPGPDEVAIAREELKAALTCVASLSTRERQALAARVLGYRPAETAELMGVSTNSVYQALSRARSTLRATLGGAAIALVALRRLAGVLRSSALPVSAAATASLAISLAVSQPWTHHAGVTGVAQIGLSARTAIAPAGAPPPAAQQPGAAVAPAVHAARTSARTHRSLPGPPGAAPPVISSESPFLDAATDTGEQAPAARLFTAPAPPALPAQAAGLQAARHTAGL